MVVNVSVPDDFLVEGNEIFNVVINSFEISPIPCVYIIDNDCKILHVSMPGSLKWFLCIQI